MQIGPAATIPPTGNSRSAGAALGAAFRVPEAPPDAGGTAASSPVHGLDALLALQETAAAVGDPAMRDRDARRHGRDLLDALAALQRALLSGEGAGDEALGRLAALLRSMPAAADPGLGAVLRAVGLRARLELARRGLADVAPGCGRGDASW